MSAAMSSFTKEILENVVQLVIVKYNQKNEEQENDRKNLSDLEYARKHRASVLPTDLIEGIIRICNIPKEDYQIFPDGIFMHGQFYFKPLTLREALTEK